ncbi:MAG: HAD family phosphatase [Clostridia bacterium]|nr:HAD family phosphatase [Clostridia bacterium]
MIKAVVFDMDGLLIDSERVTFSMFQKMANEMGKEITEEFYCTLLGICLAESKQILKEKYGGDIFDITDVHNNMVAFYEENGVPVKVGARELLEMLKKDGIKCAVASSSDKEWVQKMMEYTGLGKYFQYFVCGNEVKKAKPAPEIFLTACEKLGVDPADALVLEDAKSGIEAANNAGIPVICVPDMIYPDEAYAKMTYKIMDSLLQVKSFLEENNYEL